MPWQPLDIVVLGDSYAGVAVSRYILDNVIDRLSTFEGAPTYRIILISPSTHYYWNNCTPRALFSPSLRKPEDAFVPIELSFARHPFTGFTFIHGTSNDIDTSAKRVTVKLMEENDHHHSSISSRGSTIASDRKSKYQIISYHALVIGTGSSSNSPFYSLHSTHEDTLAEMKDFHSKLKTARTVVVVGGGPTGVETAGQLASFYNARRRRPFKRSRPHTTHSLESEALSRPQISFPMHIDRSEKQDQKRDSSDSDQSTTTLVTPALEVSPLTAPPRTPKSITLLSGGVRLLPKLPPAVSKKAEKKLKKLGVHIMHDVRQLGYRTNPDATVKCILNNGTTIATDVRVQATGVVPNTRFLPSRMLDKKGYIITSPQTLRVLGPGIGDRIYAIGDCASYSRNCTADVYDAVSPLCRNLLNDLLAHEYKLQTITPASPLNEKAFPPTPSIEEEEEEFEKLHGKPPVSSVRHRPLSLALSLSSALRLHHFHPARAPHPPHSSLPAASAPARRPLLTPEEAHFKTAALRDAHYAHSQRDTLLLPISRSSGVGVLSGRTIPGFAVHALKRRKCKVDQARDAVEKEKDPYSGCVGDWFRVGFCKRDKNPFLFS